MEFKQDAVTLSVRDEAYLIPQFTYNDRVWSLQLRKNRYFEIRCTGGKAAQICALMTGIYASNKFQKPFKIRYFNDSTGTLWSFGIGELLRDHELVGIFSKTSQLEREHVSSGERIRDFAAYRRELNKLTLFRWLESTGLLKIVRVIRREVSIGGHRENLEKISRRTRIISGNFVPFNNEAVFHDLSSRLEQHSLYNPFSSLELTNDIVIHYRLGDMRKVPNDSKQDIESRVIDPEVFVEVMENYGFAWAENRIVLLSDEPQIAAALLNGSGIQNLQVGEGDDFWRDLRIIASAKFFIGSLSQMSVLGGVLCFRNGGSVVLPSDAHGEGDLRRGIDIKEFSFHKYRFLRRNHAIFDENEGDLTVNL